MKARILYESSIPSHRLDVPPSGDTAPGKTVTLPHDAMLAEPRTALSAGGTNTGWYEGYDYEYRRTLTVPENALADTHILEFEASTIMPRSGSTVKRQRSAPTLHQLLC
mgnify:CR=1 FL=1